MKRRRPGSVAAASKNEPVVVRFLEIDSYSLPIREAILDLDHVKGAAIGARRNPLPLRRGQAAPFICMLVSPWEIFSMALAMSQ